MTTHKWPPDYISILKWRQDKLLAMRKRPELIKGAIGYYESRPVEFIEHWCMTYDPRNATNPELPATVPFVLFPKQREMVTFLHQLMAAQTNGLVEKSREMGASWVACAFSVWAWRFIPGASIGWGSRKQDLVDNLGDLDALFPKMRFIIKNLPRFFWPNGFSLEDHAPFMRILNPESGASITGESGDNIGRGGRKLIYFKDEAAHYERPELIEASLSETTRVQVDISSVNGVGNVFHRKRESGHEWSPLLPPRPFTTNVFVMDWRDDPRKSQEWYDAKKREWDEKGLPHIFAQEIDRNYASSVEGIIIRPEWVKAAIDAHITLGFDDEGRTFAGLDVADEGGDLNALAIRKGAILKHIEAWGSGDTGVTARRAVEGVSRHAPCDLQYDCIGVGAGVKAETNRLRSEGILPRGVRLHAWNAGEKALYPDSRLIIGDSASPKNRDFFQNIKAQAWWQLARRFERTYRAIHEGIAYEPAELISIPPNRQLEKELSQATMALSSATMKQVVNKRPSGTRSPNMADAVVMAYWPVSVSSYTSEAIGV